MADGRSRFALHLERVDLRFRDRCGRINLGPLIDLTTAFFTPGVNIRVGFRVSAEIILLLHGGRDRTWNRDQKIYVAAEQIQPVRSCTDPSSMREARPIRRRGEKKGLRSYFPSNSFPGWISSRWPVFGAIG